MENIFEILKKITLHRHERETVRKSVMTIIEKNPVRTANNFRQEKKSGLFAILFHKPMPLIASFLLMATLGGSLSFAAEGSLPGDLLYPLKVNVNEEVRGAFRVSAESKTLWEAERAERRLEEAENLAAEGKLNVETSAIIEEKFRAHAEDVKTKSIKLNPGARKQFESNFRASLEKHEGNLEALINEEASLKLKVEPLLLEIRARATSTAESRDTGSDGEKTEEDTNIKIEINGDLETNSKLRIGL